MADSTPKPGRGGPPPPRGGPAPPPPAGGLKAPVKVAVAAKPAKVSPLLAKFAAAQEVKPDATELSNLYLWGHGGYYRLAQGHDKHVGTPVKAKCYEKEYKTSNSNSSRD